MCFKGWQFHPTFNRAAAGAKNEVGENDEQAYGEVTCRGLFACVVLRGRGLPGTVHKNSVQ